MDGNFARPHQSSSSCTSDDVPSPPVFLQRRSRRMNARTRRKIEMGVRALGFSIARPDSSAGYATTLARLEDRLARAEQLMNLQRDGTAQVRGATVLKRDLRRIMRRAQLMHLVRVAELAA